MNSHVVSEILVFKTNVIEEIDVQRISLLLGADARIKSWNIDQHDVDHVLRIEADHLSPQEITLLMQQAGFHCEELPD
jgi:hypothetical protein